MKFNLLDKISIWLFNKILTYPMLKLMKSHKYEVQKRK